MISRLRRWVRRLTGRNSDIVARAPDPGQLPPSFEAYRDYISVHPSAIIAATAAVQMFNPPTPPRICLEIGEGCHIFSTFSLLRPEAHIKIGRNCQLGASQFIAASRVEVSDDVLMGWGCTVIDTDNHAINWNDRQFDVARCRDAWIATNGRDIARLHDWNPVGIAPVKISAKSWIGFNTTILKGVEIGEGSVIGASSVVTRSVAAWSKAAGNPCRAIGSIVQGN